MGLCIEKKVVDAHAIIPKQNTKQAANMPIVVM